MNNVAYQAKEAIIEKIHEDKPDSWPKSQFIKGNTKRHIEIIPKSERLNYIK